MEAGLEALGEPLAFREVDMRDALGVRRLRKDSLGTEGRRRSSQSLVPWPATAAATQAEGEIGVSKLTRVGPLCPPAVPLPMEGEAGYGLSGKLPTPSSSLLASPSVSCPLPHL